MNGAVDLALVAGRVPSEELTQGAEGITRLGTGRAVEQVQLYGGRGF